ncbi:MAG: phosphonate ABC transporter, permease protein PhnE [Hyphomicrobiaceae bacterium]|nr:phosphonate ABC transporter, permease protein PhnE [Hyphomicrobiaceae bacterium]
MTAPAPRTVDDLARIVVPHPPLVERLRGWLVTAVLIGILAWSFAPVEMHKATSLFTDWRNMAEFLAGFLRPNFHDWDQYLREMVETVQIAIWGTALAVLLGIPMAILASANLCPPWIVQPVRRLMDAARAINEIVFALMFVVAVGLGPLAGVLALAVHNVGIIAKLFSEAVEAIDPRPVEGIRASGASRLQEVIYGVIPQVMPLWSSFTLYRFETNVRSATVLGIVGAGGIGHSLYENIRGFQYSETAAIIIIVVATVMLIDMASARIRAQLV